MASTALDAPPPEEPSPWKALLLLGGGILALWGAHSEWRRFTARRAQLAALSAQRARGPGTTVPGRVISREDVSISGGAPLGASGLGYQSHPDVGQQESLESALTRTLSPDAIPKFKFVTARTVEDRERMVREFIREGARDPKVRAAAAGIVSRKCGDQWCTGVKDYKAEADAVFDALVDPRSPLAIRYTLDHPEHDMYTSVQKTTQLRIGDCANLVVAMGSYLGAIGHRPEMVVIQAKGAPDWSHIFLRSPITGFDGLNAGEKPVYRYFDLSLQQGAKWMPAGYEPPGTSEALATGKPSGVVQKIRVSPIFN